MSAPFRLERLDLRHDVVGFTSGGRDIDAYIQDSAFVEQNLGMSRITVAVNSTAPENAQPSSVPIIGFFSLGPTSIRVDPRLLNALGLPPTGYTNIGGYLLGRVGVQRALSGQGIGSALVARALEHARAGRAGFGGVFLAVDAEDEKLVRWYRELGFTRLSGTRKLVRKL